MDILLSWWRFNKRDFAWRHNTIPYRVVVAELLLQQTFADKVEKVYRLFVSKYPSFKSLSSANEDEVKSLILPLGLHYRAALLVSLAKIVRLKYRGRLPNSYEDLLKIKGIGDYTALCVMCHAHGKPVLPIDTNIVRIIHRLYGNNHREHTHIEKTLISRVANMIIDNRLNCENVHYALLDFGALVCRSVRPACGVCVLSKRCNYFRLRSS